MIENLINWNDSYSVGNTEMDKQHQKLIGIINRLFISFKSGKAQDITSDILDEMVNYSLFHLGAEEKYLASINYSELEEHKNIHQKYQGKILEFRSKIRANNEGVHYEIIEYLKEWWTVHILKEDMKYSNC